MSNISLNQYYTISAETDSGMLFLTATFGVAKLGPIIFTGDSVDPTQQWQITGQLSQAQLSTPPIGYDGYSFKLTIDDGDNVFSSPSGGPTYFVIVAQDTDGEETLSMMTDSGTYLGEMILNDNQNGAIVKQGPSQKWKFSKVVAGKKPTF